MFNHPINVIRACKYFKNIYHGNMLFKQIPRDKSFLSIIFGAIAMKLLFLLGFGYITPSDDALGYIEYADKILSPNKQWMFNLDLNMGGLDISAFRAIGYPFIIAVFRQFFGESFGYIALVIAQNLLSILVIGYFYLTIRTIQIAQWCKYILCFFILFNANFIYDFAILTDSIFNNLFILALLIMVKNIINNDKISIKNSLIIGGILGLSFLIRAFSIYALIAFVPLFIFLIYKNLARKQIILMILPIFLLYGAIGAWNTLRSGHFFIVYNYAVPLQPVYKLYALGYAVFNGQTEIDNIAKSINPVIDKKFDKQFYSNGHYPFVLEIVQKISSHSAPIAMKMQTDIFFRTILHFPLGMVKKMALDFMDINLLASFKLLNTTAIVDFSINPPNLFIKIFKILAIFTNILTFIALLGALSWGLTNIKRKDAVLILTIMASFSLYIALLLFLHWQNRFMPAVHPMIMLSLALSLERIYYARKI